MLSGTQLEINNLDIDDDDKKMLIEMTNERFRERFIVYYQLFDKDYAKAYNQTIEEFVGRTT